MDQKKSRINIVLIHNNENRVKDLKNNIYKLVSKLENFKVCFKEISYQPAIKPVNIYLCFMRDVVNRKLSRKWKNYIMQKNKPLLIDWLLLIYRFLQKLNKKLYTTNAIEICITNKHINALSQSIENKSDYLLVLESDAVFKKDSIGAIIFFLKKIQRIKNQPVYLDFAGGLPLSILKYDKLVATKNEKYLTFKKPVTNTACCYLINNTQAKIFYDQIILKPKYRLMSTDHLFNCLFIEQVNSTKNNTCFHAYPTVINHGSFTGHFKSWNQ